MIDELGKFAIGEPKYFGTRLDRYDIVVGIIQEDFTLILLHMVVGVSSIASSCIPSYIPKPTDIIHTPTSTLVPTSTPRIFSL